MQALIIGPPNVDILVQPIYYSASFYTVSVDKDLLASSHCLATVYILSACLYTILSYAVCT